MISEKEKEIAKFKENMNLVIVDGADHFEASDRYNSDLTASYKFSITKGDSIHITADLQCVIENVPYNESAVDDLEFSYNIEIIDGVIYISNKVTFDLDSRKTEDDIITFIAIVRRTFFISMLKIYYALKSAPSHTDDKLTKKFEAARKDINGILVAHTSNYYIFIKPIFSDNYCIVSYRYPRKNDDDAVLRWNIIFQSISKNEDGYYYHKIVYEYSVTLKDLFDTRHTTYLSDMIKRAITKYATRPPGDVRAKEVEDVLIETEDRILSGDIGCEVPIESVTKVDLIESDDIDDFYAMKELIEKHFSYIGAPYVDILPMLYKVTFYWGGHLYLGSFGHDVKGAILFEKFMVEDEDEE